MELKNLNEYKFILSTGCSYGYLPDSVFKPFNLINRSPKNNTLMSLYGGYNKNWLEMDDKVIVLNFSLGSQGSDWQADSIIFSLNKLLELGVQVKNIYCLVEWSQWNRFSISPFHNFNINLENFDWDKDNKFFIESFDNKNLFETNHDINNKFFDLLQIRTSKPFYNIGKIGERTYITPSSLNINDFTKSNDNLYNLIKISKKVEDEYPIEKKVKDYLNNIIRTQFYIKSVGVKLRQF